MSKTAILVDGGFYRKVAARQFGKTEPEKRADELIKYCSMHLLNRATYRLTNDKKKIYPKNDLYRIFYYDCNPIGKQVYHPLLQKSIDFAKQETYTWTCDFFNSLKTKRKVAIRLGSLEDSTASYNIKPVITKKILSGAMQIEDLKESDFDLNLRQKGVDMKIGLDIATLAYNKLVDQIVLISGDSDFVPAAKLARIQGIDFILDPMGNHITPELQEHIDGLQSYYKMFMKKKDLAE